MKIFPIKSLFLGLLSNRIEPDANNITNDQEGLIELAPISVSQFFDSLDELFFENLISKIKYKRTQDTSDTIDLLIAELKTAADYKYQNAEDLVFYILSKLYDVLIVNPFKLLRSEDIDFTLEVERFDHFILAFEKLQKLEDYFSQKNLINQRYNLKHKHRLCYQTVALLIIVFNRHISKDCLLPKMLESIHINNEDVPEDELNDLDTVELHYDKQLIAITQEIILVPPDFDTTIEKFFNLTNPIDLNLSAKIKPIKFESEIDLLQSKLSLIFYVFIYLKCNLSRWGETSLLEKINNIKEARDIDFEDIGLNPRYWHYFH